MDKLTHITKAAVFGVPGKVRPPGGLLGGVLQFLQSVKSVKKVQFAQILQFERFERFVRLAHLVQKVQKVQKVQNAQIVQYAQKTQMMQNAQMVQMIKKTQVLKTAYLAAYLARFKHVLRFVGVSAFLILGATLISVASSRNVQAAAPAAGMQMDAAFCRALVKHVPSADVTYTGGRDVQGRPVVPADLSGTPQLKLPESYSMPLSADIITALGLGRAALPYKPGGDQAVALGTLTIEGEKVFYNGQPITDDQQDNLSVLCMAPNGRALPPPLNLTPQ